MATYAIGDIHGCYKPLRALLKKVKFNSDKDILWFVGDLINRGPQSLDTLRFIYGLRDQSVIVLGNHDLHLLAMHAGYRTPSPNDTVDDILNAPDCEELLYWLRQQPLLHHDSERDITMVHAGIPPQWSVKKALKRAQEVEQVLRGDEWEIFLQSMYGNKPARWKKGLQTTERWRVITNYLTRMRFCSAKGSLDLTSKGGLHHAPKGYAPWFEYTHRKTWYNTIIFGHWAALAGETYSEHAHSLDTACVWGGTLTALRLEDWQRFSVKS